MHFSYRVYESWNSANLVDKCFRLTSCFGEEPFFNERLAQKTSEFHSNTTYPNESNRFPLKSCQYRTLETMESMQTKNCENKTIFVRKKTRKIFNVREN